MLMYQALYRKWRPKTFSDVIGQSHITETLQKQVAEGRTSHAYLFTGTRGTGKTTCAKILAKAVNCEHPVNGNPCNQCTSCLGIENGSFLDVLELDAASNNGVDQVRALRDEAIYSPANVKKRVYIIDEVHMLSISAFNALLKILEEPPAHLMFILATTELHKVPATILSRCQRFSFKRITSQDVATRLSYVAKQESIDLRPEGAELLSRLADGALRDGLSLLDQCAAAGGVIDADAVLEVLGLAGNLQTSALLERILQRDAKAALLLLNQLYQGGKDVGAVLGELSALVRDLLLRKTAPEGGAALLSGGYDAAVLDRLSGGVSSARLLYLASTLQKAAADLYYSVNRRTDAELCLLRLCDETLCGDLMALNARIDRLEKKVTAMPAAIQSQRLAPPAAERPAKPAAEQTAKPEPEKLHAGSPEKPVEQMQDTPPWEEPPAPTESPFEEPPLPEEPPLEQEPLMPEELPLEQQAPAVEIPMADREPQDLASAGPAIPTVPDAPADGEASPALWQQLAETCKGRLPPMYRAFLEMCRGTVGSGMITVYAPNDMTRDRLDNERVLGALRDVGEQMTGTAVQARILTGTGPETSQKDKLQNLLQFGSQFDSVEIK
jgi:DNA polymerase-3 subunit gamma/tau